MHDHGTGLNAHITFSEEEFFECGEFLSDLGALFFFLDYTEECLEELVDEFPNEDELAIPFGRYSLRGKSKKAALEEGLAAEGCFAGIYVDLEDSGMKGDVISVLLVDDNDISRRRPVDR